MYDLMPGLQQPKSPSNVGLWVAGGFAALVLVGGIFWVISLFNAEDDYDLNNASVAISQCEGEVKERLKAPSTAKFESNATGGGPWTVTGTVDAENSFGAMIRSSY